jgi:hypothetical protein
MVVGSEQDIALVPAKPSEATLEEQRIQQPRTKNLLARASKPSGLDLEDR